MKKIYKLTALLLVQTILLTSFAGCKKEPAKTEGKDLTPEEYYGVEEMGFNGIWLSPIHQSTTYHKYDVIDYYSIDKEYGTMEDFENLIAECDKRGIKVILDFVFNHTSTKHQWFVEMSEYLNGLKEGETPDASVCPYVDYYNIVETEGNKKSAYYKIGSSAYSYEGQFWDQMPDLNLGSSSVRKELEDIARFWIDKGVGGFRLDAAKEFYTGSAEKNIEVLKWFSDYIKGIDENLYLVAEVWDTHNTITQYYESGITSIFDYCYGDSSGYIIQALNNAGNGEAGKNLAERFLATEQAYLAANPDMINAPFLSNHDVGRIAGFTKRENGKIKLAAALNLFMGGSTFVYYGEELGMTGAGKDENKCAPMYWSDDETLDIMCDGPVGMGNVEHKLGSLETQKADYYSLYWYYRNAIHIKNLYPEIARGTVAVIEDVKDGDICAISKTYGDEKVYILINLSGESKSVTLSKETYGYEGLVGALEVDEQRVSLEGETVSIPPYGIAVIK